MPRSSLTFTGLALATGAVLCCLAERGAPGPLFAAVAPPRNDSAGRATRVQRMVRADLSALDSSLGDLSGARADQRRAAFRVTRRRYKRIEGVLSYYSPPLVDALNSAEAQELDDDQASGFKTPRGFQVLESELFGAPGNTGDTGWQRATREIHNMRLALSRYRPVIPYIAPTVDQLAELARLELARVSTLGITGFDASLSRDAITESADALDGARDVLRATGAATSVCEGALESAATFLRKNADFETFDRFEFIKSYVNPAFDAIAKLRDSLARSHPRPLAPKRSVWPDSVASIYYARGLSVMAYAPPDAPPPTAELVARGRELFFDPSLSGNGKRACSDCHMPEHAFTDGLSVAAPLDPDGPKPVRHTPSLINAALQPRQFADERRATLEEQIRDVLTSPAEMRSRDTSRTTRDALAAYVRSLTALNSRFDRALRGGASLTHAERQGFNVFMGKGGCGTCHFAPLFGGTLPPAFAVSDAEVIGVPRMADTLHAILDADLGRGAIDRRVGMAHAFKTPSVRNAAITGPYMHNGVFKTLDDVIGFYDRGGGVGAGADVPNQTLPATPLHLTAQNRHDLLAFLASLTDTAGLTARPVSHHSAPPHTSPH